MSFTEAFKKLFSGAQPVGDVPLKYISYTDGTYVYYCEAPPGTALSTAKWQVTRKTNATGLLEFVGRGEYEHAATDLATVQGLSYA